MDELGKDIPVFSWDPRSKTWVCERGPAAAAPPVPPLDPGAVQTYFQNLQSGRWQPTILGLKARGITVELKDAYRSPYEMGLALPRRAAPEKTLRAQRRSPGVILGALVALLVVVGAGGYAASAALSRASATPAPGTPSSSTAAAVGGASGSPSASPTVSVTPTTAPGAVVTPRPPTPAPTPQVLRLSVSLPNGTKVFYSGPGSVTQNTSFQAVFSVILASGQGGNENLTVYLGDPNGVSTSNLGSKPDVNGNYVLTLRAAVPKGDQRLSVVYGTVSGIHTLGTIAVR